MAVLPALLAGLVVGLFLALHQRSVLAVPAEDHADVVAVHRHLSRWRLAGLAAAMAVILALVTDLAPPGALWDRVTSLGRGAALAPAVGSVVLLLGTVMGELTAPLRRSATRTATIDTRRVEGIVPGRLLQLVGMGTLGLVAVLIYGSLAGKPDSLGRPGRTLLATCPPAVGPQAGTAGTSTASTGPWPGSFYAVPIGVALAVGLVIAVLTLVVVVRRPRPSATSASLDTMLRRNAGRNVFLAVGFLVFGTLGPVAAVMANGVGVNQCGPTWWVPLAWALTALAAVSVACAIWCVAGLLVNPALRVEARPCADTSTRR